MSRNIGNIPGYYWDEDKQKYFSIGTNQAATNAGAAKYVEENVKNLQRKTKRVKIERQHANKLRLQTVERSKVLQHQNLAGAKLQREIGLRSPRNDRTSMHEAWLSALRPASFSVLPARWREYDVFHQYRGRDDYGVFHQSRQPSWDGLVTSIEFAPGHSLVLSRTDRPRNAASQDPGSPFTSKAQILAEFDSHITSFSVSEPDEVDFSARSIFVSAAQALDSTYGSPNAFIGTITSPYARGLQAVSDGPACLRRYIKVGGSELEVALSSAFNEGRWGSLVVGTDRNAYVYNKTVNGFDSPIAQLDVPGQYCAIDWLNRYIVTAGYIGSDTVGKGVLLWDTRFSGVKASSLRFKIPHTFAVGNRRVPNRPTGVIAMRKHGYQVLASDPNKIRLYDTRMSRERGGVTEAVMEFSHRHDGQQLAFAYNHNGIVVAANRDNDVVAYSTINGRTLRTLPRAANKPRGLDFNGSRDVARINSLWFEDKQENLSVIRACQGTEIVEWSVGGEEADR